MCYKRYHTKLVAMIICISGYTGSGKSSVGDELARVLNVRHVVKSYKEYVKDRKDLVKFTNNLDAKFVKAFDNDVVKEARKQDCVVTTWLGPWMVKDADLRIWLYADSHVRAKRLEKATKIGHAKTYKYVVEKDESVKKQAKKIYGLSLEDHSIFDAEINSERFNVRQIVGIISAISIEKGNKKFK